MLYKSMCRLFVLFLVGLCLTACHTDEKGAADAAIPRSPSAGATLEGGPTPDPGEGLALPAQVFFKDNAETHNSRYYAAVRDGDIWVKPNRETTGVDAPWQKLTLIPSLEGDVIEIAMDDEHIIALNSRREIHTMWNALDDVADFRWQKAWGFPCWYGPGMVLPDLFKKWDFSVASPREDKYYTDPAGNHPFLTAAKCSHIIALYRDGQHILLNDPWLVNDLSYEIPGPKRGRFIAVNSSASGATTFLINAYGDMFTRIYDFDLGGMNNFIVYTYYPQTDGYFLMTQLPAFDWVMQPKIKGRITDRISIFKVGIGCIHRTLRVEGLDAEGHTGYYEKDITEPNPEDWVFHRTEEPLKGTLLVNKDYDSSDETLGASEDRYYASVDTPGWKGELMNFNCYVTPIDLRITLEDGQTFNLILHTHDRIRLKQRVRGLDENPRAIAGCIEVPAALYDNLSGQSPAVQRFIKRYLWNMRYTDVTISATLAEVSITGVAWAKAPWRFTSAGGS